jgi:hypothetical protein
MGAADRNVKRVRCATQAVMLMYSCGFPSGVKRRVLKSGKYPPRKILSRERCIANARLALQANSSASRTRFTFR